MSYLCNKVNDIRRWVVSVLVQAFPQFEQLIHKIPCAVVMLQTDTIWLVGYFYHQINKPCHRCYSKCLLWWLPCSFHLKAPMWIHHTDGLLKKYLGMMWKLILKLLFKPIWLILLYSQAHKEGFPGVISVQCPHFTTFIGFMQCSWLPLNPQSTFTCGLTLDSGHFREMG